MVKRIGIAVAAVIVIIVVAAAIAPYFVGLAAESAFKDQVALANARYPAVHIEVQAYDRGFYGSEATLSVSGSAQMPAKTRRLWAILLGSGGKAGTFHMHISHGPIPFADFGGDQWSVMPVLYTASFRGNKLPPMSIIGAFKPQLHVERYFSGALQTTLTVPPGRFSLGVFDATWEGGQMVVNLDSGRENMHMQARMKPVHYQFQDPEEGENFTGTLHGFSGYSDKHKVEHDFWVGQTRWTYKGSEYKENGEANLILSPSTLRSRTQVSGEGRWLGGAFHLAQIGGQLHGWDWTTLSLDGSISKINALGLRQAIDAMEEAPGSRDIFDMDNVEMLYMAIPKALTPDTQGALNLVLSAPDGQAELHVTLDFKAPKAAPITRGLGLGTHADLTINLDVDHRLVNSFSTEVLGASSSASVYSALQKQVDKGYLTSRDGAYHSTIRYRSGVLTVNGKVVEDNADHNAER